MRTNENSGISVGFAQLVENPLQLISNQARTCYMADLPADDAELLDIEKSLIKTGHHSTIEAVNLNILIDGISINSVTFGLHLAHAFYSTGQRSGRYSKMYSKPDMLQVENYINAVWPDISMDGLTRVLNFVKQGTEIYARNIEACTIKARKLLAEERPNLTEKRLDAMAPKIAQEQLRMVISTISPTGMQFNINLLTLSKMYRAAWSPELKYILQLIVDELLAQRPELDIFFKTEVGSVGKDWNPEFRDFELVHPAYSPSARVTHRFDNSNILLDQPVPDMYVDSFDAAQVHPGNMESNMILYTSNICCSIATMGQDQRHRTIERSAPVITNTFYIPELLKEIEDEAMDLMREYKYIIDCGIVPKSLALAIAPYGLMVEYKKISKVPALMHEQGKRGCWCSQTEVNLMSLESKKDIAQSNSSSLSEQLAPPCLIVGSCPEGGRYCGRDMNMPEEEFFNFKRKV